MIHILHAFTACFAKCKLQLLPDDAPNLADLAMKSLQLKNPGSDCKLHCNC